MNRLQEWWHNDLSKGVKIVLLTLLANGLPAFLILMSLPDKTEILFVWTINPEINARLVGVMYSNALLLVIFSAFETKWEKVRVNLVVITLFSIFATVLTFFYLKPFLAHPWFHLAYWLTMYLILFFVAPYVFWTQEKEYGGKLPVQLPLSMGAKLVAGISTLLSLFIGINLLFNIETVNQFFPWKLPPLVGGLIGVLFSTHVAAWLWALWDGDWMRVRPIFWQAPPLGLFLALLPLIHPQDLLPDRTSALPLFYLFAALIALPHLAVIFSYRAQEKEISGG